MKLKIFSENFFEEIKDKYNYSDWVSFRITNDFKVNLMFGHKEELTQSFTFEISLGSLDELKEHSKKYGCEIRSFVSKEAEQDYNYSYIEIPGPKDICKVVISYIEDIK